MWKFGSLGLKILRMLHILLIVLFLGGILSSFALLMKLDLSNFEEVYSRYQVLNIISDNIVKVGAQGIILLGAVYGFFTRFGFTKHRWLAAKWLLFIVQTFIGIFVVDKLMVENLSLLNMEQAMALTDPVFRHNHYFRLYVIVAQIGLTLLALALSVLKPGRSRTASTQ